MDFGWLYDSEAGLLHTGYDVEAQTLEGTHHGLLTSGAMLAGFVAIARRQVPLSHWAALAESDPRLRKGGARDMGREELAEHLLPTLFVWFPPATLLGQAAQEALEAEMGKGGPREAEREGAVEPSRSVLALRFQPERAVEALRRVARTGQVAPREQAMALAAVANLTCDDILVRHFHQHWQTAWVEALVYESMDTP
jgi:cyclic beta-1,2-glucan synthetase